MLISPPRQQWTSPGQDARGSVGTWWHAMVAGQWSRGGVDQDGTPTRRQPPRGMRATRAYAKAIHRTRMPAASRNATPAMTRCQGFRECGGRGWPSGIASPVMVPAPTRRHAGDDRRGHPGHSGLFGMNPPRLDMASVTPSLRHWIPAPEPEPLEPPPGLETRTYALRAAGDHARQCVL